jgi:hypothetical protein
VTVVVLLHSASGTAPLVLTQRMPGVLPVLFADEAKGDIVPASSVAGGQLHVL